MTSDLVRAAVARSAHVAEVVIGQGVLAGAGALYARHFSGPACLFADEAAWAAAGPAVMASFQAAGIPARLHLIPADPRPKPTVDLANRLARDLQPQETPVALGSGVMNDVVKHAAYGLGRPYLCIATAASMDGYTSAGAPLSVDGFKMTIPCRPARAILADLDVLAAAPRAMTGWGFGDLAGKVPAGGDWMIADALGIEAIDTVAWPMVQDGLAGWLAGAPAIAAGDPAAMAGLFEGLTLVGLAMEAHGSSRPASGADHQIAHLWEMQDLHHAGERVSHGTCVAVGTLAVLRLYDWVLEQDLTQVRPAFRELSAKAAEISARLGPLADRALAETTAKHVEGAALAARIERLAQVWPDLRARLRARLMTAPQMAARLGIAGVAHQAAEIGVDREGLRATILAARFLRSRYTLLDLLDETGLLPAALDATLP